MRSETENSPKFRWKAAVGALLLAVVLPQSSDAQHLEARIDAFATGPAAVHAGLGATWTLGTYLRSGIAGAIGASGSGVSGRFDQINRFHLDPFREHSWGPYGGGGLGVRLDENRRTRYVLLLIAGVDGPVSHGLTTAIEAGFGGGARVGVTVRRAGAEKRR